MKTKLKETKEKDCYVDGFIRKKVLTLKEVVFLVPDPKFHSHEISRFEIIKVIDKEHRLPLIAQDILKEKGIKYEN